MSGSLWLRIVAGGLVATLGVLAVSGVAIHELVARRQRAQIDAGLVSLVEAASLAIREELGRRAAQRLPLAELPTPWAREGLVFVAELADGTRLAERGPAAALAALRPRREPRTLELEGRRLRVLSAEFDGAPPRQERDRSAEREALPDRPPPRREGFEPRGERPPPDGRPPGKGHERGGRPRPLAHDGGPPRVTLSVAEDLGELDGTLAELRTILVATGFAAALAMVLFLGLAVRRGLRPLDRIGDELAELDAAGLDRRFAADRVPSELRPLIEQLDAALARLERSFAREERFAADAAHELRTPLAGIRSTLELALLRERSPAEWRRTGRRCLAIAGELQALCSALLELARGAPVALGPVALAPIVEAARASCAARAAERGVAVAVDVGPEVRVLADPALLERLLINLLANGAAYADPGSALEVRFRDGVLWVENAARGAPPDLAERALEPFWRADAARSGGDGAERHAGLGLALARNFAEAMGARLELSYDGTRFRVRLRVRSPRA